VEFQSRAAAEKVANDLLAIPAPRKSIIFVSSQLPVTEVATVPMTEAEADGVR
jgi:hypothetical protein